MMKSVIICIVFYAVTPALYAQENEASKYVAGITANDLKKHLTIIAGADMEGRETSTAGQRKAAAYIEDQFKSIGLQAPAQLNGYQQTYTVFKDTMLNTSIKIGKKKYLFGKDFISGTAAAQNQDIKSAKIIFVGYGITDLNYDDYQGKDVRGKIVVFFTGEPKSNDKYIVTGTGKSSPWTFPGTSKKVTLAKQQGAVAAFVINPAIEDVSATLTQTSRKSNIYFPKPMNTEVERVNYTTILPSLAKAIFGDSLCTYITKRGTAAEPLNTIMAEAKLKTKFRYRKQQLPFFSSNVIGYVEGSDKKDEFVFITAHYDHLGKQGEKIYYGADDDGSGTVSVIEMAESFARARAEGNGPRRTVVFMTVSGEEKGLWGSQYYSDNPVFPLDKTTVDLNIDMVGRSDPGRKAGDSLNYVYVIGDDKLSTDLKPITTDINNRTTRLELDYKFNDPLDPERIFFRSDHYNFAKKGVPIIFYFDGIHQDYHKTSDTVDKINFDLLEKRVHLIFLTAWEMANRENMLARDIPLPPMER